MFFKKNALTVSIFAMICTGTQAAEQQTEIQKLETIEVSAHPLVQSAVDYAAADNIIKNDQLRQGGATIGEALSQQVGVYSNQFGRCKSSRYSWARWCASESFRQCL